MEIAHVFIDTNIFLHYRPIDDILWKDVVGAKKVVVCVAPIVVEELDDQKDSHRLTKIRQRARKALQTIEQSMVEDNFQIREGVSLQCTGEPDISFPEHGLRENKNDDNLVASVLSLNRETRDTALLVTGDTGPRIKAASFDIPCMGLPEKYRAQSALSEIEKKNRQLQRKINRLENQLPELELVFEGGENHCEFRVSDYNPLTEKEIDAKLEEIKEQYPQKEFSSRKNPEEIESIGAMFQANPVPFSMPSKEQIERYNDRLDDFYDKYKEYMKTREFIKDIRARMITIYVIIENRGSAPAKDIDVFMHFPDGFKLFSDADLPDMDADKPQPPQEPKGGIADLAANLNALTRNPMNLDHVHMPRTTPPGNVSSPNIEQTNSYDVNFSVRKLKHTMRERCGPFYVVFDSFESASSFEIKYRINTASLPDDTEGKLGVRIEKD